MSRGRASDSSFSRSSRRLIIGPAIFFLPPARRDLLITVFLSLGERSRRCRDGRVTEKTE